VAAEKLAAVLLISQLSRAPSNDVRPRVRAREDRSVFKQSGRRVSTMIAAAVVGLLLGANRAWAQTDPNPGAMTITGNVAFLNQYMFRGIRQNSTGMAIWPSFDLGIAPESGKDEKFGYFSIADIVTVPLGGTTKSGSWNVHAGAEFQKLGETTKFFNGGESNQFIGSVGLGFSY
jgi:hypothetical protein